MHDWHQVLFLIYTLWRWRMDKDYIYKVLRQQVMEWTGYPTWGLRKEHFANISYNNWAVNEVLKRMRLSKPDESPQDILISFMSEMDELSKLREDTRDQFEVARDVAANMLDVLYAMIPPEIQMKGEERWT